VKTAKYPEKIAALWTTFLLGTLFHTQLGLMPLFHGQSIVESHQTSNLDPIFWGMLSLFCLEFSPSDRRSSGQTDRLVSNRSHGNFIDHRTDFKSSFLSMAAVSDRPSARFLGKSLAVPRSRGSQLTN